MKYIKLLLGIELVIYTILGIYGLAFMYFEGDSRLFVGWLMITLAIIIFGYRIKVKKEDK